MESIEMNYYEDIKNSEISISKDNEGRITGIFNFPENLDLFKGHFPGNSILPGVFQIEMIKYALEKTLDIPLTLLSVRKTKFSSQITPGMDVNVEITIRNDEKELLDVRAVVRAEDTLAGKAGLTLTKE